MEDEPGGAARAYGRERRASAAVEFALWLAALAVPIFAATDVGFYAFQSLQLRNAAQMAAQAAWAACDKPNLQPATAKCGEGGVKLNQAIHAGQQSTSLGATVTLQSGAEKFWCVSSTGAFVEPADVTNGVIATVGGDVDVTGNDTAANANGKTCTVGAATATPGDYIVVTVQRTYRPIFPGLSVVQIFGGAGATMTATAWSRIA